MPEIIRGVHVQIRIEVDTNKRTEVLDLDRDDLELSEVPEVVREFVEGLALD